MLRRDFLRLTAAGALTRAAVAAPDRKLNVLFIPVDDLRPTLGCYGDPLAVTPHIDRLARRGILFTRAYCQQAVCNPSRASLITGRRPDTLKVWDLRTHFRDHLPDVVTLPQHVRRHGYTARSIGKVLHGTGRPSKDPPSWSAPAELDGFPGFKRNYLLERNQTGRKAAAAECVDAPDNAYRDGQIADLAVRRLRELKQAGKPFFLAVGFKKPHLPFCAPKRYWGLHDRAKLARPANPTRPSDAPDVAFHNWKELRGYTDVPKAGPIAAEKIAELRHGYYAAVSYADAQIGRVLDELNRLGLAETTVVVLWGDHGFHLGEHGLWCKTSNFELDTRCPLIFSVPGQANCGAATHALVEFVDVYPTLVELCGLPMPSGLEGTSVVPLLTAPTRPWKTAAFSQFPRPAYYRGTPEIMGYSLRTARWRYTEWRHWATGQPRARELYDHEADPRETRNLAGLPAHAQDVTRLAGILRGGWRKALPPQ